MLFIVRRVKVHRALAFEKSVSNLVTPISSSSLERSTRNSREAFLCATEAPNSAFNPAGHFTSAGWFDKSLDVRAKLTILKARSFTTASNLAGPPIENAGSKATRVAVDDLQASLYKQQKASPPAPSLSDITNLLKDRHMKGKLVDSDVLRKLISAWTKRGMGRQGLHSILDLLEILGPKNVSERLLDEHRRQGLAGLWQFREEEWKLDLHGADVAGGQVLLLAWFGEVRRRLSSEQGPNDFRVVTGWGKHSRVLGVSELSTAIKLLLQLTDSPFKPTVGNAGRFEAKAGELRKWLKCFKSIEQSESDPGIMPVDRSSPRRTKLRQ